jgi:putative CocE/NonD family hydrolase
MSASGVEIALDVPVRMRDGVVLRANVYRPAGAGGPWPTLLLRTPYRKDLASELAWCGIDPVEAVRRGFIVVVQDTRGRFASDGEWEPLRHEALDGWDTIEWAARLPGSNGRVGTYGGSYCGSTQWMPAIERPPSLAAICPLMTWSDPFDGLFARGGAVELGLTVLWTLLTGLDHLLRIGAGADAVEAVLDELDGLGDACRGLPVAELAALRRGSPELGGVRASVDPAGAADVGVAGRHERVEVPSFHVGGWYDCFVQGTLDGYEAMVACGREARLIVGPWTHERFADPVGELSFGTRSGREAVDVQGLQLAWLRAQLDPQAPPADGPAVRIFTMGRDAWRDEAAWPPARARAERWLLRAGGALAPGEPDAAAPPSAFAYDPADPVPTVGGATVMWPAHPPGPLDQAAVEARADVLVFTSEPLERELEVTGRVRVVLHAVSSTPSTDWVARLCDVHPDGRSFNVCDGIVRVAAGADELRRVEIDLWSTSIAFLPGHRLRVHVTSSSFPRWDRNLNTGDQRAARMQVARQTVFHDADRASWIELPAIG